MNRANSHRERGKLVKVAMLQHRSTTHSDASNENKREKFHPDFCCKTSIIVNFESGVVPAVVTSCQVCFHGLYCG